MLFFTATKCRSSIWEFTSQQKEYSAKPEKKGYGAPWENHSAETLRWSWLPSVATVVSLMPVQKHRMIKQGCGNVAHPAAYHLLCSLVLALADDHIAPGCGRPSAVIDSGWWACREILGVLKRATGCHSAWNNTTEATSDWGYKITLGCSQGFFGFFFGMTGKQLSPWILLDHDCSSNCCYVVFPCSTVTSHK